MKRAKERVVVAEALGEHPPLSREDALLRGRVAVLYTLSHNYLFLPFAALCMAAALLQANANLVTMALPFLLQIVAVLCGNRLKSAYDNRGDNDDPKLWARRSTVFSGVVGTIWGLGAVLWFAPSSFSAEAYLVLAFLGMSATEFIARAAYRPAYLAHAIPSLAPLAAMLVLQGGLYQLLSALLLISFAGVLYFHGETVGRLLDQSIVLRHHNAQLIARLNDEKRMAEATRDAAKTSERAKSAFISNISHELRTPLNAILGMAQLLERSDLEKAQRDHVKVLLEAGRGLKTLLDDIIALASQSDESPAAPEEGCDAAQAARTVARLLQPNAWEKRLRLSVNIAAGLPRVAVDARLLRRVLLKLVGNSIKFTERGNVEIALDAIADSQGPMVRFVITDTGPGIPSVLLDSIFQPFAKGENSYSARRAGAGVGLSVAKKLIESVGGSIGVESEPGMGASFWITVPATQTQGSDLDHEVERSAAPSGLTLLAFVGASDREALDPLLAPFGNRITFVDTLVQASTMSTRGGFDMILATAGSADVLAAAPGQTTPILALTARDERRPEGADGVLRWPATPDALYSAITAVIGEEGARKNADAKEQGIAAAIDAKAIADLEKALGFKTLIDILQSYVHTAEELASAIFAASEREDWGQAGRLAQDFAGAAGGLGLVAIAAAARSLAQGARDGAKSNVLSAAADEVLSEDRRVREALRRLYPALSA